MEKKYDVIVVLGGQIVKGNFPRPASHTWERVNAARKAYRRGLTSRFIICGGYNYGVRYKDYDVLKPPHFSFEAMARARSSITNSARVGRVEWFNKTEVPSEAQMIAKCMNGEVPGEAMILEELSATIVENAQCVKIILSRTLAEGVEGTDLSKLRKIGLITQRFHMDRAVEEFRKAGLQVEPLCVEDLLSEDPD